MLLIFDYLETDMGSGLDTVSLLFKRCAGTSAGYEPDKIFYTPNRFLWKEIEE
jgi:hypothetical protein